MLWHPLLYPLLLSAAPLIIIVILFLLLNWSATSRSTVARRAAFPLPTTRYIRPSRGFLPAPEPMFVGPSALVHIARSAQRRRWWVGIGICAVVSAIFLAVASRKRVESGARRWNEGLSSLPAFLGLATVVMICVTRRGREARIFLLNQLWLGLLSTALSRSSRTARITSPHDRDQLLLEWVSLDVAVDGATYRYAARLNGDGTAGVRLTASIEELADDSRNGPFAEKKTQERGRELRWCATVAELFEYDDPPILTPEEMGWLDEDDADLLGCISVLNRDTVLRDVELWDVEILTPEEMGCVDDCGGFLDGDDEFTLLAGCSFDPSSPADCDIWDVPVLSPAEMGWQDGDDGEVFLTGPGHVPTSEKRDHPDFLRRAFSSESSCAAANDDAEFPILTPIEMGWLGENDDTFLSGILTANADDDWRKRASSLPSPPISPPAPLRRLVKTLKTTAKKVAPTNAAPKARRQQLCRRTASLPSPPASPPLRRCRPRASVCAKSGR